MKIPLKQLHRLPTRMMLITVLGVAIFGVIGYNIKDLLFGAPLDIAIAKDGTTLATPFLPVAGTTKHAKELLINGRPVAIDRKGNFNDEVLLSPGYNIVEIALRDQFGKQKVKTYQLVVAEPPTVASAPATPYQ